MKKTVICSITMQENAVPIAHAGEDRSIPASLAPTVYPVVDYLAQTMQDETDVHFILLRKLDPDGRYEKNTDILRAEFAQRCGKDGQLHGTSKVKASFKQSIGAEAASSLAFRQMDQKIPSRGIAFNRLVTILCRLMCTCGKE